MTYPVQVSDSIERVRYVSRGADQGKNLWDGTKAKATEVSEPAALGARVDRMPRSPVLIAGD